MASKYHKNKNAGIPIFEKHIPKECRKGNHLFADYTGYGRSAEWIEPRCINCNLPKPHPNRLTSWIKVWWHCLKHLFILTKKIIKKEKIYNKNFHHMCSTNHPKLYRYFCSCGYGQKWTMSFDEAMQYADISRPIGVLVEKREPDSFRKEIYVEGPMKL